MTRRIVFQRAGALLAASLAWSAGWPRLAFAQAAQKKKRVGMLIATNADATTHLRAAFTSRLADLGWREGMNIEYVVRYAQSDSANYERLSADMVARKPDLIFVGYGPFAAVVRKHTKEIPIVFTISQDPVGEGIVSSLARPGGNVTGTSTRNNELVGKRLQLLKEVLPSVSRIGVVRRIGVTDAPEVAPLYQELNRAAARLGMQVVDTEHENSRGGDFGPAFMRLAARRVEAVATVVNWNYAYYRDFARNALEARLPTICDATEFAEAGALLSLSIDRVERYRRSAEYVDRILRGTKPTDLPVEEPTEFELVVNIATAKRLGVKIPQSVLLRAGRIIGQ